MTIFISGSRDIFTLSEETKAILDEIISNNDEIVIGDCMGADFTVQKYLKSKDYENVSVYVSGFGNARYNIGYPEVHIIGSYPSIPVSREFYAMKDISMSKISDKALVLWNGKSRGSKNNIDRMKSMNKPVIVNLYNQ